MVPRLIVHPQSLDGYPWLEYDYSPTDGRLQLAPTQVRLKTVMRSNSTTMLHHAARFGIGLAILSLWLVQSDLESGRLIDLFPDKLELQSPLSAIWLSRRYLSARVQVFLNLLSAQWAT